MYSNSFQLEYSVIYSFPFQTSVRDFPIEFLSERVYRNSAAFSGINPESMTHPEFRNRILGLEFSRR